MLVINDLHIGLNRQSGTTPDSAKRLREYTLQNLNTLLDLEDSTVVCNGDLFDDFEIETGDIICTGSIIKAWLAESECRRIHLIAGNHDWKPKGDQVSSFHLLEYILNCSSNTQAHSYDYSSGYSHIKGTDLFCIPHMANQDLFDAEIEKAIGRADAKYLLLHCNYQNNFSKLSDHSLNLDESQVERLLKAGWDLIIGHEHVGRTLHGGRVIIAGNQFPTSIQDCIDDPIKYAIRVDGDEVRQIPTWTASNNGYTEMDWKDLMPSQSAFIRVIGEADISQASEAIKTIAGYRQSSNAYIIGNAVKFTGSSMNMDSVKSLEDVQRFNILGFLKEQLTPDEFNVVKSLLD